LLAARSQLPWCAFFTQERVRSDGMVKLVVGLGNPGPQHERTRHNVGFDVLDRIALAQKVLFQSAGKLELQVGTTAFSFARSTALDAILLKPEAYMNRSGEVVSALVRALGVETQDLFVVYDDFDLPLGALRMRPHGGAGSHNGMRSIVNALATESFPRLRVGIGRAGTDAARHVLERFTPDERVEIEISVAEAAEAILAWLATGDIDGCMTRFHSRWNQGNAE
jgi:PTH1 family peptidyl-tRNA hydrolase